MEALILFGSLSPWDGAAIARVITLSLFAVIIPPIIPPKIPKPLRIDNSAISLLLIIQSIHLWFGIGQSIKINITKYKNLLKFWNLPDIPANTGLSS